MRQGVRNGLVVGGLAAACLLWSAAPSIAAPKSRQAKAPLPGQVPVSASDPAVIAAAARIDQLILEPALAKGLSPAPRCDDETFLRRATIDLIARIPTAAEYEAYFRLPAETRRAALVDRLLSDPRFNDRWAMFFGDMMNIRSSADGGATFHGFIRDSLRDRKPYDQMVRQIITATGTLRDNAPVGFFLGSNADALEVTGILTQTLMGVRMQCAQCHDHPYDIWTQKDYYGLAAYFGSTDVRYREETGSLYVIDVKGTTIMWPPVARKGRPQQPVEPRWPLERASPDEAGLALAIQQLDAKQRDRADHQAMEDLLASAESLTTPRDDTAGMLDKSTRVIEHIVESERVQSKREAFADLMSSPTNKFYGWNLSNRVWAELMGRGIVTPVDDIKSDNPPSNPALLDELSRHLLASNYDMRALIAAVVMSEAYQRTLLEGKPAEEREPYEHAFVSTPLRRMNAESIYDSIRIAGHVDGYKHSPGRNMREISVRLRVPEKTVEQMMAQRETPPATPAPASPAPAADPAMMQGADSAGGATAMVDDPYASETRIDVEGLLAAITLQKEDPLMGRRIVEVNPDDVDPAKIAMREAAATDPRRFRTVTVKQQIDDNPVFESAMSIRAPAPPEHFLRQFGQTSRVILGEKRDTGANTRQALLLLNGKLANEAARVGDLEPAHKLLHEKRDVKDVVELIYIECLTRKPGADELDAALAMFAAYDNRADAVADLRWAIFNSHAFRYLP